MVASCVFGGKDVTFGCKVSQGTVYRVLKENNLSWKKYQKVLKKANPAKRAISSSG